MTFRTQRDLDRLTLPAGKTEVFHFDARCPGLSVRIQRTGKPAFVAWYTASGKRKRITLGAVAGTDLDQARRQATEIINAARDGRDPIADRRQAQKAAAEVFTLGDLIRLYLSEHAERHQRPRTLIETRRALERHWTPLHGLPASEVGRRDVSTRLLDLARSTGAVGANRARANLSAAFAWAIKAGLAEHNPVVGTVKGEEISRDRVLSPGELAAIWRAGDDAGEFGAIVRLLTLTGQRREEVAAMSWPELDVERGVWTVPAARAKNGHEHEVPLARQALALLEGRPRPFLFGRRGRSPFSGFSRAKARLDQKLGDAVAPWVLHDLRRSWVTHAVDVLSIQPHVAEAAINHVSGHKGGVAGIYNRSAYRAPKAAAMQAFADWLDALVEDREPASNVVALAGR